MPRPIRAPGVQPLRELAPQSPDLPQSEQNESKVRQSKNFQDERQDSGHRHQFILPYIFCD